MNVQVAAMQTSDHTHTLARVGQPRLKIDLDDVEFLRSLKFSWKKIAIVLNVRRSTLTRGALLKGILIYQITDLIILLAELRRNILMMVKGW